MRDIFLLDLDETLLDFCRAERENFFFTLAKYGVPADGAAYDRFHAVNDGLWKLLERGGVAREEIKTRRFEILFRERGVRADVGEIARAYYENFLRFCYPYEGAAAFLRELSARGRVYLVTNGGSAIQRRHIADAGFKPYLDGAFISEEMGANKPSARFCALVREGIADYAPARAAYLGDSLTSDAPCAETLGAKFVLYKKDPPAGFAARAAENYRTALSMMLSD